MAQTRIRNLVALSMAAGVVAASRSGVAQDDVVRVEYRAGPSCPSHSQFLDDVKQRTVRSRLARAGEIARTFTVTVSTSAAGSRARLEIKDTDRPIREVAAKTCAEAVHAIALVTALAMDARATPNDDGRVIPAAPVAGSETTPQPASFERSSNLEPIADSAALTDPARERRSRPHWETGAQFVWHSPIAPTGARGGGVFFGRVAPSDGWSFRGTFFYMESGVVDIEPAGARFSMVALRADACPIALNAEGRLALRPCFAFEGGSLRSQGRQGGAITTTHAKNDLWLAAGFLARVTGTFGDFFLVEAQGGPFLPLVRREYTFVNPDVPVHEIPTLGWSLGAGVGFVFL